MDKKLGGLLLVFFILFGAFVSSIVFNKQLLSFTRAKEDFAPSAKASLLFGYPLFVKADGKTKSIITVFVRSDKGTPVKNQKITLTASVGQLSNSAATTNNAGKATVSLTSTTPGSSVIGVTIGDAIKITQPLSILFE